MSLGFAELIGWAISLLSIAVTLIFGLVKLLLAQMEKRLAVGFEAQSKLSEQLSERQDTAAKELQQLERAFLKFQADLPLHYVRREDWVRNQSVIEAKLDGLALKFENVLLKGARND